MAVVMPRQSWPYRGAKDALRWETSWVAQEMMGGEAEGLVKAGKGFSYGRCSGERWWWWLLMAGGE